MVTARALTSFATSDRSIHAGQEVDIKDPIVARFPSLFATPTRSVEQATAAPGEKRTRSRGK